MFAQRVQQELSSTSNSKGSLVDWTPNPGPQTEAFNSKADILGYGGAAGGGKSDLILGLAATAHKRSVIFRRVFPNLRALIERSRKIFNPEGTKHSGDSYNETLHRWSLDSGQMLEFEACQYEKDKQNQRGRDRDFYAFDEATEFSLSQIMFMMAWNRTVIPGQRCRVVLTFNPPTDEAGGWIVEFFLPWLAYLHPTKFSHPNPAAPGELRWFTTIDGEETEVPDGREFVAVDSEMVYKFNHKDFKESEIFQPLSRSFIPAKLSDNPYISNTGYRAVLQAMPEPFRSQLLDGDFSAACDGDPWQVIPTAWIDRAMDKWVQSTAPIDRIGLDVARGGKDFTVKATVHSDGSCDELVKIPGTLTPDGDSVAKLVYLNHEPEDVRVAVDVIGVGSSPVDILNDKGFDVVPMAGSARAVVEEYGEEVPFIDEASGLKCVNLRAGMYWNLRHLMELDLIALFPDKRLKACLIAQRWTPTAGGIKLMSKDKVKEILGYSPDESDAVAQAYWLVPASIPVSFLDVAHIY